MRIRSALGAGTTVLVRLPAEAQPVQKAESSAGASAA